VKLIAKQISLVLASGAIETGAGHWVCAAEQNAGTQYASDLPRALHCLLDRIKVGGAVESPQHRFRWRLCIFLPAVLITSAPLSEANALTPREIYEKVALSVVVVQSEVSSEGPSRQGSGVVIAIDEVITNCHVLNPGGRHFVSRGSKKFSATLRYADSKRDLCQLRSTALSAQPVQIGTVRSARPGDRVFAIGAPKGLELSISEGLVSALREEDGSQLIQTTAQISPTQSGRLRFFNLIARMLEACLIN